LCSQYDIEVSDVLARALWFHYGGSSRLALAAAPRADRPILLPYFDGERTPDRPAAGGVLARLGAQTSREEVARAAFEGVLCGLFAGLDTLRAVGVPADGRILATGGGAASPAYLQLLADMASQPVLVCDLAETSAAGAAIQAAAVRLSAPIEDVAKAWAPELVVAAEPRSGQAITELRARYDQLVGIDGLDRV
jgi:xylulokinase